MRIRKSKAMGKGRKSVTVGAWQPLEIMTLLHGFNRDHFQIRWQFLMPFDVEQIRNRQRQSLYLKFCPGWCGSVDWVPARKPKRCQFDSHPGHMPGLRARSLGGGFQLMYLSHIHISLSLFLSPSLPISLKINKIFFKKCADNLIGHQNMRILS